MCTFQASSSALDQRYMQPILRMSSNVATAESEPCSSSVALCAPSVAMSPQPTKIKMEELRRSLQPYSSSSGDLSRHFGGGGVSSIVIPSSCDQLFFCSALPPQSSATAASGSSLTNLKVNTPRSKSRYYYFSYFFFF